VLEGKVRVDALVGHGGFGVVYRARHLGFDEPVAVKFLRLPPTLSDEERAQFQKAFHEEGRLLHRLSRATSTIVQAHDVGAVTSPSGVWTPYLVLEWLDGCTLQESLEGDGRRGITGYGVSSAFELLDPAAHALQIAHDLGVAHRDIKPENLFRARIGDRSTLKILDFGIAKIMSDTDVLARAYASTGWSLRAFSPPYAAPEQFDPSISATGPWTDIYALALVFVELACGKRAYVGNDATQLLLQAKDPAHRPTLASRGASTSRAVENVLHRALAVDPRNRYASMKEFWSALRSAIDSSASSVLSRPVRTPDSLQTVPAPAPTIEMPPQLDSRTTSPQLDVNRTAVVRSPRRRWERFAVLGVITLGVGLGTYFIASKEHGVSDEETTRKPMHTPASTEETPDHQGAKVTEESPEYGNGDGVDPHFPVLPAEDVGFLDDKGGRKWGDKCWLHLRAGKLGWAKAECDKAMEIAATSADQSYMPSLIYNEGLLAQAAGDIAGARSDYQRSLNLRNKLGLGGGPGYKEVRAALDALDDPSQPRTYPVCSCTFPGVEVIVEGSKIDAASECCQLIAHPTPIGVTPRKPRKICPCTPPGCLKPFSTGPCSATTYRDGCCVDTK
jgi:serine/threonine protein kinase